jgi:hypothetical protein
LAQLIKATKAKVYAKGGNVVDVEEYTTPAKKRKVSDQISCESIMDIVYLYHLD